MTIVSKAMFWVQIQLDHYVHPLLEAVSEMVRIVYAGGVTSDNCADYAGCDDIDGCLVGAASLR